MYNTNNVVVIHVYIVYTYSTNAIYTVLLYIVITQRYVYIHTHIHTHVTCVAFVRSHVAQGCSWKCWASVCLILRIFGVASVFLLHQYLVLPAETTILSGM